MLEQFAPSARAAMTNAEAGRQWWKEGLDAWLYMVGRAMAIADDQQGRREWLRLFASLYSGQRLSSLYHFDPSSAPSEGFDYRGHRVTWNLVQAAVDTGAARIAKSRTRIRILTFGGDWKQQRRAEKLTRWLDGLFHEQAYYDDTAEPCFMDAAIFDGGIPKIIGTREGIQIERVLPFELLVDKAEGMSAEGRSGRPRNAYHVAVLPRDAVEDAYGTSEELKETIRTAPNAPDSEIRGDVIQVIEGWHVSPTGSGGRRIVAVANGKLADEPWPYKRLPIPKRFVYGTLPTGYWGQGMVARLVPIQLEITRTLKKLQEAHRKMVGIHWAAPIGSNLSETHLTNFQGSVIHYAGDKPPVPLQVMGLPKESYDYLLMQWQKGFELLGLSQQAITGEVSAALAGASGVAKREQREQEQERFSLVARRFDELTVDVADITIATARQVFGGSSDARVRAPGTRILEEIKWSEVDMKEDSFVTRAYPANLLPTTPAARLERINELKASGTISPEAADSLLDMPDVEAAVAPGAAQYEEAFRAVSRMLDEEEYEAPDEALRPDLAITIAEAMYLRAKRDGAPPAALGAVLRWRDDNRERLKAQAEEAMPPPAVGAGLSQVGAPPMSPQPGNGIPMPPPQMAV